MKKTMFGKYLKHILILTFLAGMSYTLPQVNDAITGAFSLSEFNPALTVNAFVTGKPIPTINSQINNKQMMMQGSTSVSGMMREENLVKERRQISPSELIMLLFKAGIISQDELPSAIKILKEHAFENREDKMMPPYNGTSTPPMMKTYMYGTSTKPQIIPPHREGTSTSETMMRPPMQNKPIPMPPGVPRYMPTDVNTNTSL